MDNLEIDLPSKTELIIRVPDKRLYSYDFTSFSLLQKIASQRMKKHIKNVYNKFECLHNKIHDKNSPNVSTKFRSIHFYPKRD